MGLEKRITLFNDDCRKILPLLSGIDSVVCDPPYELGFMGKSWDASGIAYDVAMWKMVYKAMKPGAYLLAFGGSRTYHRLACAVEDAGFEIRDQIMWLYGSGFPKSLNVSKAIDDAAGAERQVIGKKGGRYAYPKEDFRGGNFNAEAKTTSAMFDAITAPATDAAKQWDGWGTALKPAHEPIVVARKPLIGTVAENVLTHGTGALNIDGCRVEGKPEPTRFDPARHNHDGWRMNATGTDCAQASETKNGRWPANIIHDGSDDVLTTFPNAPGQQGDLTGHNKDRQSPNGCFGKMAPARDHAARIENDKSAARFFYCAKASKADRGEGNAHPTVKPTALMRYLCRLVTPPGGLVLDPFVGSGSTGKAAMLEGFRFVGIDSDKEHGYFAIAQARIEAASIPPNPEQQRLFI